MNEAVSHTTNFRIPQQKDDPSTSSVSFPETDLVQPWPIVPTHEILEKDCDIIKDVNRSSISNDFYVKDD